MTSEVAPDGSPVWVYLALPPGDAPRLIATAVPSGGSILELGCGTGRVTHPLVAAGFAVTAVDQSPEMLRHVAGAETVLADIETLRLGAQFDAVVLASHLVNTPDPELRRRFWRVCAAHARPGGAVLVERHHPAWVRTARPGRREVGEVAIDIHDVVHDGDLLHAAVTYQVGHREWTQRFTAVALDDPALEDEADRAGLSFVSFLDRGHQWLRFRKRR